jgi:hypothetical protein
MTALFSIPANGAARSHFTIMQGGGAPWRLVTMFPLLSRFPPIGPNTGRLADTIIETPQDGGLRRLRDPYDRVI